MNAIVSFRKCTLTNKELIEKVNEMTDNIYSKDGIIARHIPARPNEDYDLLIGELLVRFKELSEYSIIQLEKERMEWSLDTFQEATPLSSLHKAREEIREIEQDLKHATRNPEEYADAIMCLFDSAGRQGIEPMEIMEAYTKKIKINKSRVWKKNPDNSYSHV